MAANKSKYSNIAEIKNKAQQYGVDNNPFFKNTLANYETVQISIEQIHKILIQEDMTITKEYVKGRENTYLHPAIKELPRLVDIANKTMDTLLKIIVQLGTIRESDELLDYIGSDKK